MGYIILCGTNSCKRESLFRAESARYNEQNARCSEYGKKKMMILLPHLKLNAYYFK